MLLSAIAAELDQASAYRNRPLIDKLVDALATKISRLPMLDVEGAGQLQDKIEGLELQGIHKHTLSAAVDAKLEVHLCDEKEEAESKNQTLTNCQEFASTSLTEGL